MPQNGQSRGLNPERRDFTLRQGRRNGGAESRKVFRKPPQRTTMADASPPDSAKPLFRVFLFCEFLRLSAGGKRKKNILRVFESPCLRVKRKQFALRPR